MQFREKAAKHRILREVVQFMFQSMYVARQLLAGRTLCTVMSTLSGSGISLQISYCYFSVRY